LKALSYCVLVKVLLLMDVSEILSRLVVHMLEVF